MTVKQGQELFDKMFPPHLNQLNEREKNEMEELMSGCIAIFNSRPSSKQILHNQQSATNEEKENKKKP